MLRKGFTIVEILIVVAIFSLMAALIFNVFILSQKFYRKTEDSSELLQNGRIALERISRDLRQASELVTQLPQVPDVPQNPPPSELEFQDGHTPSPYQDLGSNYYYIRYYVNPDTSELHRQYRVYCYDSCAACSGYYRWNDSKMEGGDDLHTQPCDLEDKVVAEYVRSLQFWGLGTVNISLSLNKGGQTVDLQTGILGRNF
ncbi:MAG: prepilin-type N-terminal cleavage/methylation domain-containing protein [Candidatus Pacebacteria bacterium]|nr:prepilin-type N-terminal cleavage/methylation domain-containing protein [Candidatus Paceibacterota bacterium]